MPGQVILLFEPNLAEKLNWCIGNLTSTFLISLAATQNIYIVYVISGNMKSISS